MSLKSKREALKSIRVRIAIPASYAATIDVLYASTKKNALPVALNMGFPKKVKIVRRYLFA